MAETGPPNARPHPSSHDRKPTASGGLGSAVLISPRLDLPAGTTCKQHQCPWAHPPRSPCNTPSQTRRSPTLLSSLFGKRIRQSLVLVKRPLGTTQEPLVERHVRFDFPLLTRERVVLDAQQGAKRERGERKLVGMTKLVLCWCEMEERRTF